MRATEGERDVALFAAESAGQKNYCVILAGGIGSRLWPVSRKALPKQFLDWFGVGRTLLQQTYDRFVRIVPRDHIFVVTNEAYAQYVTEQLPELSTNRVLMEPIRRNTLPSVAWATTCITLLCDDANVVVTPADQVIMNEPRFEEDVLRGLRFVSQQGCLLTMGVKPTRPDTGYGYIQVDEELCDGVFSKVKSFTEKPEVEFAKMFVASGEFYWNTGLYLYNVRTMTKAIHDLVPDYRDCLTENMGGEEMCRVPSHFNTLPNLSLDYSILEKSENVYVQVCGFGWADFGSWSGVYCDTGHDEHDNLLLDSQAVLHDAHGNVICMPKGRVAIVQGLNDFVVAEHGNVLMICPKHDAGAFRRMHTNVQMMLGEDYL